MMGAPFEHDPVPDSAIVDFIAFIVGNDITPPEASWQRLTTVRELLRRYGKLPVVIRNVDAVPK
jgi:hypothetical protein